MIRSLPPIDPPGPDGLRPDGPEAERLLREELSRADYARGLPQLIKDFIEEKFRDFIDFIRDFESMTSTPGKITLLVLAVVLVVLALVFVRFRRSHRAEATGRDLGLVPELSGADYRARAAAAATAGNYALACLESFRALIRSAEERTVLAEQPGRTAVEAGTAMGRAFPGQASQLTAAADLFNELRFGHHEASNADYRQLRDLEATLENTTPDLEPSAAPTAPAAPR